jgi:hypothetical protein
VPHNTPKEMGESETHALSGSLGYALWIGVAPLKDLISSQTDLAVRKNSSVDHKRNIGFVGRAQVAARCVLPEALPRQAGFVRNGGLLSQQLVDERDRD